MRTLLCCLLLAVTACSDPIDPYAVALSDARLTATWHLTLTAIPCHRFQGGDPSILTIVPGGTVAGQGISGTWDLSDNPVAQGRVASGSVNRSTGATSILLFSGASVATLLSGTIAMDGTFTGTFTDPAPGYNPLFQPSFTICVSPVNGTLWTNP